MKKILLITACCMIAQWTFAQAPKWAEKAKKAVFSVVTYNKDNQIKGTGNGFYIDARGIALSDYTLFEGAERAVIVNADGKQLDVNRIMGADDMYDVVKFTTPIEKKQMTLSLANQPAKVGETVYLLPYSTQKATTLQTGKVTAVDSIGNNSFYYTLEMKTGEKTVSCPILNSEGYLLGMIQKNASDESTESYALGATYGAELSISALAMNKVALNKIGIKKALPDTEEQALVYLFMSAEQMDNENYLSVLNDFLVQYPNSMDGYIRRANFYMHTNDEQQFALADADLKKAIDVASDKNEARYQVAKTIYSYMISLDGKEPYQAWNYDAALELVSNSQSQALPFHIQLAGDILFAQGKYADAYTYYEKVNQTELVSAATYYTAAKAKQQIEGSDLNEVLALMDSAIVKLNKPYFGEAAPYFYERAELRAQAGKYRDAGL
ncbi:MAG: serine protease [Bacteroides sp.]|nr:serine protease [Bacteroides sp.]